VQRLVEQGQDIPRRSLRGSRPPQTILDFVNRSSFTGLAVLFYFNVIRVAGIRPVVPVVAAAAACSFS
jgi:hypothetical protein